MQNVNLYIYIFRTKILKYLTKEYLIELRIISKK